MSDSVIAADDILVALDHVERDEKSFWDFCREDMFGPDGILDQRALSACHKDMCEWLQTSNSTGIQRHRLTLWPRGSLKTTIGAVAYPIWRILRDPDIRILVTSETYTLSRRILSSIRATFENAKFIGKFGNHVADRKWKDTEITISSRKNKALREATVSTAGVDVSTIGGHYEMIVADDLHSELNSQTSDQIAKVVRHYRALGPLLEPGGDLTIIGTRWDESDAYAFIMRHMTGHHFSIRKAEENGVLLFPEKLNRRELDLQKARLGSYMYSCNPAGAPILMSDFTCKSIENIEIGDEVVGFQVGNLKRHTLIRSTVLAKGSRIAPIVKVKMESGREVRCTPDHKWYVPHGHDPKRPLYREAAIGRRLSRVCDPLPDFPSVDEFSRGWLSGIFDGEGGVAKGRAITISQSPTHNPEVCRKIEEQLKRFGIQYNSYLQPGGLGDGANMYVLRADWEERRRLLLLLDPIRKARWIDSLYTSRFVKDEDKIISITPDGEETVYSFQTTSGNYVAWGYASKNCLYQNEPVSHEEAVFRMEWLRKCETYEMPKDGLVYYIAVDPALLDDTSTTSDYTAIVTAGVDREDNWWIVDVINQRLDPGAIVTTVSDAAKRWNPLKVGIEVVAYQKMLKSLLDREMTKRSFYFQLDELRPGNRKKDMRIRQLQPRVQFQSLRWHPGWSDITEQFRRFRIGRDIGHDDVIDAIAYLQDMIPVMAKSGDISNIASRPGRTIWEERPDPNEGKGWYSRDFSKYQMVG